MKKFAKFCCGSSGANVESSRSTLETPSEPAMEPPFDLSSDSDMESYSDQQLPEWSRHQVIQATKCDDSYSTGPIRFMPNGDAHRVVISIERKGGWRIRLIMDGVMIFEKEIREYSVGKVELNIDGMVFDFLWLLNQVPERFTFSKKASCNDGDGEAVASCLVQIIGA